MKLRQLKRAQHAGWNRLHKNWDYISDAAETRMYPTRHIKPCKTYSQWCTDCNTVLFRKLFSRFPHTMVELDAFENAQQKRKGDTEPVYRRSIVEELNGAIDKYVVEDLMKGETK